MNHYDNQILKSMRPEMPLPDFNWKGKKILIVEDDYANYLFFHEILSCAGACLLRAVSIQEAYDMLISSTNFDLMIINTDMPGNENCRSVKRIKLLWPFLRVIAVGGSYCTGKSRRCHPAGCDALISYHVDGHEMRMVVNEMFVNTV